MLLKPLDTGRSAARRQRPSRPRWAVAWIVSLGQIASWGSTYYAFSAMIAPMHAELGWSLARINAALSLGLLAAGLTAIPVGAALHRGFAPAVMGGGALATGALLVAWASVTTLPAFYVVWVLLGCTMAAVLYDAAFAVVTRLFGDDYRRGIALVTLVGGFASTVSLPLIQLGIASAGWRRTLVALGIVQALVVAPIQFFALRCAAKPNAGKLDEVESAGSMASASRASYRDAFNSPVFTGLAIWFTSHGGSYSGFIFQLLPMLALWRVDTAAVLLTVTLIGPMQVFGRIALVAIGKKASVRVIGIGVMLALASSTLALMLLPRTGTTLVLFAALYGSANGMMTLLRGTSVAELLGQERFAEWNGLLAAPTLVANAAAPAILGTVWTMSGRPEPVLWTVLATAAVAIAGILVATKAPSERLHSRDGLQAHSSTIEGHNR
jgi:MFS family permease